MKKAAVPSILVSVMLLAVAVIAEAQQPKKVPRIGYLSAPSLRHRYATESFRQGLRDLGLRGGEEYRHEWFVRGRHVHVRNRLTT